MLLFRSAFLIGLACSAAAAAADQSIQISGTVPTVCRVAIDPVSGDDGGRRVLQEFCNNPGGYRVILEHSSALAGLIIEIDGKPITLSDGGSTEISRSSGAGKAHRAMSLDAPGFQGANLIFRIVPT